MINTQGAFSYTELMAMELGEYIDLIKEIGIVNSDREKAEHDLDVKQQMKMAENDPAIPHKRL